MIPPTPRDSTPLGAEHDRIARRESDGRIPAVDPSQRPGAAVGVRLAAGVEWLPYGPARSAGEALRLVATYGSVEAEYAAIRRGAGLLDAAHRGTIVITGADGIGFLNRMVTQRLADIGPGMVRSAFWLNRKGRIDADLLIAALTPIDAGHGRLWIDVDRHHAEATVAALTKFVFSEAVEIEDRTESVHRLALHGRAAPAALAAVTERSIGALDNHRAATARIGAVEVIVVRRDQCGEPGFEISIPVEDAISVWSALCAVESPSASGDRDGRLVRPIGWHAYNIARIEAGTPLFNVDFDTTSLPHETGVLRDRVSFTKGCYLGQEIVARMESLGKPKQTLVGLRIESEAGSDVLPEAGSTVCALERDDTGSDISVGAAVGAITSSTLSPMLAAAPIAMAMIRSAHASPGTRVLVFSDGGRAIASVGPLRAWGSAPPEPTA